MSTSHADTGSHDPMAGLHDTMRQALAPLFGVQAMRREANVAAQKKTVPTPKRIRELRVGGAVVRVGYDWVEPDDPRDIADYYVIAIEIGGGWFPSTDSLSDCFIADLDAALVRQIAAERAEVE